MTIPSTSSGPAVPPPPSPPPPPPPSSQSRWQKPEVVVAIAAAAISLLASLGALWLSSVANTSADQANELAVQANATAAQANIIASARNNSDEIETMSTLSDSLIKRFDANGIDDAPALASFFFRLGSDFQNHVVAEEFYNQQIRTWCPVTRRAHDKLQVHWVNNKAFRDIHQSTPWYLAMLDKMVGNSSDTRGGCL